MKWVPMSPFVDQPQMKNVPARSQNDSRWLASPRVCKAIRAGAAAAGPPPVSSVCRPLTTAVGATTDSGLDSGAAP